MMTELLGKSKEELREIFVALGEPAFRGAQIYHALYSERKFDVAQITNLPAALRERLSKEARITLPEVKQRFASTDGSVRYLFGLTAAREEEKEFNTENSGAAENTEKNGKERAGRAQKPASVEAVFMPSEGRQTICVSTQAGCAVDCHFCLTAQLGLVRNLTAGEILAQVLIALEDHRESLAPRTNVVLMGQGEPLLNYEPVMAALRIMLGPNGMGLAARHVTLSTSGIVPGIERMAQEKIRPKLAISLNASTDEERDAIMPINRKYPLEALIAACRKYPLRPREQLTFEYVLLGGFNDSPEDARRVARLIAGIRAKVNLIPWNPGELPFEKPDPARIEEFRKILADKGMLVFVRSSRGQDVMAACGQLALLRSTAISSPPAGVPLSS